MSDKFPAHHLQLDAQNEKLLWPEEKEVIKKRGIIFPLMASTCEGETMHSSAAKDSICMS